MNGRKVLVGVIFPGRLKGELTWLTRNYLELAGWLNLDLAILTDPQTAIRVREALQRKKTRRPIGIVVHNQFDGSQESLSRFLKEIPGKILVVPETDETLISSVILPILVLPKMKKREKYPLVRNFIVPLSGEKRMSSALETALSFADRTETPVALIHVMEGGKPCSYDSEFFGALSDQSQHEYPRMLDRVVAEGSPFSHRHERRWVRELSYCTGDVPEEILSFTKRVSRPVLVLEWKGSLEAGHAKTVKRILKLANVPVLLVRTDSHFVSRLKVASGFKAA